jgi:hypothetical protein
LFWKRFDVLENESPDGIVGRDKLMRSLVSNGKFFAGDHIMLYNKWLKQER